MCPLQITGMCRGYAKNIINDLGIVIQGEHEGELPERMLAVGSLNRINVGIPLTPYLVGEINI